MERDEGNNGKRRRQSHCCVPGCNTGYKKSKDRVSLFKIPSDPEKFEQWRNAIPTSNKVIHSRRTVCELHFEPHCIERFYRTRINGEDVLTPRGVPFLLKDAVPSIFPDFGFQKSNLKKRTTKKDQQTTEDVKLDIGQTVDSSTLVSLEDQQTAIHIKLEDEQNFETDIGSTTISISAISTVTLPSPYWTCIRYPDAPNTVCFATWNTFKGGTEEADKRAIVEITGGEVLCSMYLNHVKLISVKLNHTLELRKILLDLNEKHVCKGLGNADEFSVVHERPQLINKHGSLWSKQCYGSVEHIGLACRQCRYQRKLLWNLQYKAKIKETKPTKLKPEVETKMKMKILAKRACRLKQRVLFLSAKLRLQRKIEKALLKM